MVIIQTPFRLLKKKTRWEIKKNHRFKNGIDETMSVDNCTHSFFGASKTYADLIVQEYGKNTGLRQLVLEQAVLLAPIIQVLNYMVLSYLVKASLNQKKYSVIGYKGKQVRDNIHSEDLVSCLGVFKNPRSGSLQYWWWQIF